MYNLLTYSVREASPNSKSGLARWGVCLALLLYYLSYQASFNLYSRHYTLVYIMSNFRTFTPRDVEARIAAGDTLVIYRGHVLHLNKWQDVHPGGRLVIQHMVGRDASDELSM